MHVDFGDQGINLLLFKQFKFQYLFILMDTWVCKFNRI